MAIQRGNAPEHKISLAATRAASALPLISIIDKDIPSRFLGYPEESEITYRPYTYGEILKFSQSKFDKIGRIKFLLDGIQTSFPIEDLYYFDFLYISVLRKLKTFSQSELIVSHICSNCETKQKFNFNLSNIDYKDLDVSALPIILDVDDSTELHFKPLTVGKFMDLSRKNLDDDRLAITVAQVINKTTEIARKLVYGLSGEAFEAIREIDTMLYFGMKTVPHTCAECGFENAVNLGGDGIAIEPFREHEVSARSKIRFGV